jgi:hypothetical protein
MQKYHGVTGHQHAAITEREEKKTRVWLQSNVPIIDEKKNGLSTRSTKFI